jgi:hypothetical protein
MTKQYITVTEGRKGFFAVRIRLRETDVFYPFWEPCDTGIGRYAIREEAIVEAREWAKNMEMEYRD